MNGPVRRIGRQSVPADTRHYHSALKSEKAEKIAALGGEEAAVAKAKAESLVSAKSETPSAATKPKSNDGERNADAGGTDKRAAGALMATTAPRDSIATSSIGPESKAAKVVDSSASKFPLPVTPPALAPDINEYSKWTTLEHFGYEFKGIQLISVLVSLSLSLSLSVFISVTQNIYLLSDCGRQLNAAPLRVEWRLRWRRGNGSCASGPQSH